MRQPRRPELGQREDRSPPRLCQRSLTLQSILTVGSKSGHLHSLHRCRNRPCALQVLDWRPQGSPQPRSPDVAAHQQCNSRSLLCLGHCNLALLCIHSAGSKSDHQHNLRHCRNRPRTHQEAGKMTKGPPQPRSPGLGQRKSRLRFGGFLLDIQLVVTEKGNTIYLFQLQAMDKDASDGLYIYIYIYICSGAEPLGGVAHLERGPFLGGGRERTSA